jgi:hypothetical protein
MRGLLVTALVLLAGCETREDRLAAWRAQCQRDYGFTPGTEAFAGCVQRAEQGYARRLDAAAALAFHPR